MSAVLAPDVVLSATALAARVVVNGSETHTLRISNHALESVALDFAIELRRSLGSAWVKAKPC